MLYEMYSWRIHWRIQNEKNPFLSIPRSIYQRVHKLKVYVFREMRMLSVARDKKTLHLSLCTDLVPKSLQRGIFIW